MSAFYENDGAWPAPAARQPSWESQQQAPPSRSGASSALSQQESQTAFASQFEEIDRATDNLMKNGKWFPGAPSSASASRRDSTPAAQGSPYADYSAPRLGGAASRHHSVSEYDGGRSGSASGLQGFYAAQRFQPRQSEAEQMLQAKRRMAAQRERELRNYHQEQQYNRSKPASTMDAHVPSQSLTRLADVSGVKSDRSMSPTTMSEDDRRELIARQHRALYGNDSTLYTPGEGAAPRQSSQDVRNAGGNRGSASPLAFDPFGAQAQTGADGAVQMPPRERANSTSSPASNPATQQSFSLLNDAQQSSRTSTSSPGGSPPLTQGQKGNGSSVAPIGTRPAQNQGPAAGLNKRSTTPLTPSSLSYGFSSNEQNPNNINNNERSTSAASNPPIADKTVSGLGGWGSNSGVWGSKNTLGGVQASVWG